MAAGDGRNDHSLDGRAGVAARGTARVPTGRAALQLNGGSLNFRCRTTDEPACSFATFPVRARHGARVARRATRPTTTGSLAAVPLSRAGTRPVDGFGPPAERRRESFELADDVRGGGPQDEGTERRSIRSVRRPTRHDRKGRLLLQVTHPSTAMLSWWLRQRTDRLDRLDRVRMSHGGHHRRAQHPGRTHRGCER